MKKIISNNYDESFFLTLHDEFYLFYYFLIHVLLNEFQTTIAFIIVIYFIYLLEYVKLFNDIIGYGVFYILKESLLGLIINNEIMNVFNLVYNFLTINKI